MISRPFTRLLQRGSLRNYNNANQPIVVLLTAAIAIGLTYLVESLQRGSAADAWHWLSANPKIFAVNAVLVWFVELLVAALAGSVLLASAISAVLLSVFGLISFFKTKLIGEPFYPWDIILNKEGMNIAPLVTGHEARIRLIVVAGLILALTAAWIFLRKLRLNLNPASRITAGVVALLVLLSVGARSPWTEALIDKSGLEEINWNQTENYANNGIMAAFTLNVKNAIIPKPAGYGMESLKTIAGDITAERSAASGTEQSSAAPGSKGNVKPNVIFIMSEAFWDPTLLPGLTFSEDPAPNLHRLQKDYTSGYLVSPVFGGGTANSEFEVMSGLSMSFLPSGSIAYQQYVSKPLPSLPGYFKENGYTSLAIHPYEGWFWNRNKVYPLMGFDAFKTKAQFTNPEIRGDFISDAEVSKSIIQAVDANKDPMFIYTVTMQNHGPYDDNRYGTNSIKISGNLTNEARSSLETYAQGVHDADSALQKLVEHFQESDEPTVIIFYGDHLPMLGYDYDTYVQTGFLSSSKAKDWKPEEWKKIRSVPFVMWSNFTIPKQNVPGMSYSFLGSYVLNALHMELPGQFALDHDLSQKMPVLLRNLTMDNGGNLSPAVPAADQQLVDQYKILQYDLMFGQSYMSKYLDKPFLSGHVSDHFDADLDRIIGKTH